MDEEQKQTPSDAEIAMQYAAIKAALKAAKDEREAVNLIKKVLNS